jgi:hypothetical protein
MHQLKREVDRATERAIYPRQLGAKFNHFLRDSVDDPRNQQKLTTAARTGVEGVG